MDILVTYDVSTETAEGRKRLRKVAKVCEGYGQRVQKSVFECTVTGVQLERLRHRLLACISLKEDSLRIYFIPDSTARRIENYGIAKPIDFGGPLVV